MAEARSLVEAGQFDEALARLQPNTEPEALYLQGLAWARKAERAPLPTPLPGAAVGAPELKPEEIRAIDFLEQAVAARPDCRRRTWSSARSWLRTPSRGRSATPRMPLQLASARARLSRRPPLPVEGPDASPERVIREYQRAAQADPTSEAPVEALIAFAARAGRLADADSGFQELLKREKEKPEPFIAYGDFLRDKKQDVDGAIDQYRQALIWGPTTTPPGARSRTSTSRWPARTWTRRSTRPRSPPSGGGEVRHGQGSPQGQRLQEQQTFLAQIRGRSPGR